MGGRSGSRKVRLILAKWQPERSIACGCPIEDFIRRTAEAHLWPGRAAAIAGQKTSTPPTAVQTSSVDFEHSFDGTARELIDHRQKGRTAVEKVPEPFGMRAVLTLREIEGDPRKIVARAVVGVEE